jgi:hypothetical protein
MRKRNPGDPFGGRGPSKDGYRTGFTIGQRDKQDNRDTLSGERERLLGILRDYWFVPRRQLEAYSLGLTKGYRIGYSKADRRNPGGSLLFRSRAAALKYAREHGAKRFSIKKLKRGR